MSLETSFASIIQKLRLFKMAFQRSRRRETTGGGTYQDSLDPLTSITCERTANKDAQNGQRSHPPNPGAPRRAFSRARPQGVGRLRRTLWGTSQGDLRLRTPLGSVFSILTLSVQSCRRTCARASAPAPPSPPATDTSGRSQKSAASGPSAPLPLPVPPWSPCRSP